jgi:hypothetical protein
MIKLEIKKNLAVYQVITKIIILISAKRLLDGSVKIEFIQ